MGIYSRIRTANDNSPSAPLGVAKDPVVVKPKTQNHNISPSPLPSLPNRLAERLRPKFKDTTTSLKLAFGLWAGAFFLMVATLALGTGTGLKALASISLLWTGLWSSYVCADHGWWRVSEVSVVTAIGGLMGGILTTANYFGFGLTLADGLMLMSILPLPIGYLLRSRICILTSTFASLILASIALIGLEKLSTIMIFIPLILVAQIFIATKIRSGMAITLAIITAYYWGATFIFIGWSTNNLPLTFAAAALFIIGMAHHRFGKASEDKKITGSSIHIHAGWVVAMVSAIGFQYYWLTPDALQNETATLSAMGLNTWKTIVLASLVVIICSAIVRYKQFQMSLLSIFLLTASSALLPLLLWFPSLPQSIVAFIPSINVMEAIGVLIGSSILAASIGMMLNGVRRHSIFMMGLGSAVLFAEAALLVRPNIITFENIVILLTGALISLAVGGLIAGSSLAYQAPAPRLKHS